MAKPSSSNFALGIAGLMAVAARGAAIPWANCICFCTQHLCLRGGGSGVRGLACSTKGDKERQHTTLIVSSDMDLASKTMAQALCRRLPWDSMGVRSGGPLLRCVSAPTVYMWLQPGDMVTLDGVDEMFKEETGVMPSELIFISRHASESGKPTLTVHPIGNPGNMEPKYGGRPGLCPPPSPRIAPLYRRLVQATAASPLRLEFEASLEATHHGPWVTTPSLFAEVGSAEAQWGREDAADLWADILTTELNLEGGGAERVGSSVAVVSFGGGHYCPKAGDAARGGGDGLLLGHIVASYALDMGGEEWKAAAMEGVESTRRAYEGGGSVVALVDKKSFKAPARIALVDFLEKELGVGCAQTPKEAIEMAAALLAGYAAGTAAP